MALTDGQLVERVRSGDREAFGDLVGRYRDMVYGLGYHLNHDFEAARDLAQEAFVQAYLKLGQLRDPDRFSGWLRQITTNVHRAHQRRKEVATVTLDEAGAVRDARQPSEIEVVVRDALARLREPERLALTLHYVNGYSHAEIGEFLGVRPETIKTRLARARQHLRTEVMAMVEETFRAKSLGEAFQKDVVGTVRELERDLRRGLPSDLPELGEIVKEHWQKLLSEVREGLPEQLAERAAAGGAIQVRELPEALGDKLSRAAQWLWLDRIIFHLLSHTSELRESMWVGLGRHPKGDRLLQLWGDVDPKAGGMRGATFPERPRRYRMSADMPHGSAPTSQKALQARLVEDVRGAVAGLRAGIGAQLPVPAAELYAEAQSQFERLAAAWMGSLSEEDKRRLEAGERVPFGELSARAQQALRELAEVDWLRSVVARIAVAPEWARNLEECQITSEATEERTGQPAVKLEHPGGFIMMGRQFVSAESSGDPEELKAVDS
jgi:RNA polymerase sigma-70 factor (ECF subfamily)